MMVRRSGAVARSLLAVSSMAALAGCGSRPAAPAGPGVIELPSFQACGPLRSASGPDLVLAVRVIRPGPGNALITAGVCLDGQGPFTFVVDTGAEATGIDARLASRLHVSTSGSSAIDSFGCSRSISFARLGSLSVDGLSLPSQTVVVGPTKSPALPGLMGVLGSDVLHRFGAVRIDYDHGTLTLSGTGQSPPDAAMRAGTVETIPAHTAAASASIPGGTLPVAEMTTQVSVAGHPANFVVDTGAVRTFVSPALAARAGLPAAGPAFAGYTGYDCPVRTSQVALRTWSVGPAALAPTTAYSNVLPAGVDGLLGSGTLAAYSPVVVDYRDSALLLGAPPGSR